MARIISNHSSLHDSVLEGSTCFPVEHIRTLAEGPETEHNSFLNNVTGAFRTNLDSESLDRMSSALQQEFINQMREAGVSMLPSMQHALPSGRETGDILAIDVGGSTLRISAVHLQGRTSTFTETLFRPTMRMTTFSSYPIDEKIRHLEGKEFFRWMATRIRDSMNRNGQILSTGTNMPMALTWSFPMEQNSSCSGSMLPMGKGFHASEGLVGQDIGELLETACREQGLLLRTQAIVNDATATLMSKAFETGTTYTSLVMGTGINAAAFLPTSALSNVKYGRREMQWILDHKFVLVNTELSTFGAAIWPITKWDRELMAGLPSPEFQSLEYRAGGRYLGEIVRLVLLDAVDRGVIFKGKFPGGMRKPYSLDTSVIAKFESDHSSSLKLVRDVLFQTYDFDHDTHLLVEELEFIRNTSVLISTRSAALLAVALDALTSLQLNLGLPKSDLDESSIVGCTGSIIEKLPQYRTRLQMFLDALNVPKGRTITLEMSHESSLCGAAVAAMKEMRT